MTPAGNRGAGASRGNERFRGLALTLSSIGYAVSRRFQGALQPFELHPREFAVLRTVAMAGGQSQQQLSERLQIPRSRMVAIVDQLQTRGLLARRADANDRRVRQLHLTDAGHTLLEQAFRQVVAFERELSSQFSAEERERLLGLLERLAVSLDVGSGIHPALGAEPDRNAPSGE